MKWIATVVLVMNLAACASEPMVERRMARLTDRPESYKTAYGDGCSSSFKERSLVFTGEYRRDDNRMKTDPDYTLGWNDGYRDCDTGGGGTWVMMPKR